MVSGSHSKCLTFFRTARSTVALAPSPKTSRIPLWYRTSGAACRSERWWLIAGCRWMARRNGRSAQARVVGWMRRAMRWRAGPAGGVGTGPQLLFGDDQPRRADV